MTRASGLPIAVRLWLRVIAGYSFLSCILTWPLPRYLQTRLLGDPSGDLGTYIWNVWIFRHELLRHARAPFSTEHVFAFTGGADFSLHNYAPIAGALGAPLISPLGIVGAFNALVLAFMTLSGVGVFILARGLGLRPLAAWSAGALFMTSPVLVGKTTAHFSLVIAFALPLFLHVLFKTLDSGRVKDAALVGILVAAAHYSDSYYGIYCVLMGMFVVVWRFGQVEWPDPVRRSARLERILHLTIGLLVAAIAWRAVTGTEHLTFGPVHVSMATLYTPQLILLMAVAMRAWLVWRPVFRLTIPTPQLKALVRLGLVSVGVCLLLLLPPLIGIAIRLTDGRMPETAVFWRSSPRGLDALAYAVPNPNHAWFGDLTRHWFMPPLPDAFPEYVGAFSIVAFAIMSAAAYHRLLPRFWVAFTGFFVALSLGPFIHVAGINTYFIAPWALLRYVPVIGMARSPARFAIVAVLGLSILAAFSVQELWRRYRVPRWAAAVIVVALLFELIPAPRALSSAAVPDVYRLVAVNGDETKRLLELPVGIRDGTSSLGDFNASSEYFQTTHRRPLIGGYLSRVSEWRKRENERTPMLRALLTLSEGRYLAPDQSDAARRSRDTFLRRACVKFVILNKSRATSELRAFAADALRLTLIHEDATYALFTPVDPPSCDPPSLQKRQALSTPGD